MSDAGEGIVRAMEQAVNGEFAAVWVDGRRYVREMPGHALVPEREALFLTRLRRDYEAGLRSVHWSVAPGVSFDDFMDAMNRIVEGAPSENAP